jgi:hypothetical protein
MALALLGERAQKGPAALSREQQLWKAGIGGSELNDHLVERIRLLEIRGSVAGHIQEHIMLSLIYQ